MRRLDIGNGGGIEFLQRRFAEPEAPGEPYRERVVQRLPAHSYLRHGNVRIVVEEGFVTSSRVDIESMKSGDRVFLAENRNARLHKNSIGFPSAVRGGNRRIAGDIAADIELVGKSNRAVV